MARRLFTVEDSFRLRVAAFSVPGIVPQGDERFRIGDPIKLKRPDGSEIAWQIGGLEMLYPRPPQNDVVILLKGLGKDDVPIGTEVWSVDSEGDTSIIPSRPWAVGNSPLLSIHFAPTTAWNNESMLQLVEQIAASGYAVCRWRRNWGPVSRVQGAGPLARIDRGGRGPRGAATTRTSGGAESQ